MAASHPSTARESAKILLPPGFALELGLYFLVLLIFIVPAWRSHKPRPPPRKHLSSSPFACFQLPLSFDRWSSISTTLEFTPPFHTAPAASSCVRTTDIVECRAARSRPQSRCDLPSRTPRLLHSLAVLTLITGLSTVWQSLVLRDHPYGL